MWGPLNFVVLSLIQISEVSSEKRGRVIFGGTDHGLEFSPAPLGE